jgi:histidine triad (HIT) family protein
MVAGLEVPHAHLHLVPIQGIGDLSFANAKPATNDALAAMAKQIIAAL